MHKKSTLHLQISFLINGMTGFHEVCKQAFLLTMLLEADKKPPDQQLFAKYPACVLKGHNISSGYWVTQYSIVEDCEP